MKTFCSLLVLLIYFTFSTTCLQAGDKIKIHLHQPPPNKLGLKDLWMLDVTNSTRDNIKIYLTGTGSESQKGLIVTGKTKVFSVSPGTKTYTYEDFKSGEVSWKNKSVQESVVRTGNVPEGEYTTCVTALYENGEVADQENCIEQGIKFESIITLISPADGEDIEPNQPVSFMWTPVPKAEDYSLRIVEIKGSQSVDAALNEKHSFFEKKDIKITTFQLQSAENRFETGRSYAWEITANNNSTQIGRSNPSVFTYRNPIGRIDTSVITPFLVTPCDTATNWDFETGDLCGWKVYGDAFETQPTYGNNIRARAPGLRLNENRNYWIGTYENRHDITSPEGGTQGDGLMGALISKKFIINSNYIHFLLGGGRDESRLKVELLIKVTGLADMSRIIEELERADPSIRHGSAMPVKIIDRDTFVVVSKRTGENSERMKRNFFAANSFRGSTARITIIDSSGSDWGHINVDDFRFTDDLPGDIWVTGMEITQSTQTQTNQIPLIGYKKTAVRVYVQSRENSEGPWNNVTARLTVSNISGVFGSSPITSRDYRPVNGTYGQITLSQRDTNRNNLEYSFLFLLDPEHTATGQRQLKFELLVPGSASYIRAQMNPDNDTLSKVITFTGSISYLVYGLVFADRYDFPALFPAAPFSDFEQHRKYTENIYPLSHFYIARYLDNATSPPTFDSLPVARQWASRIAAANPGPTGTFGVRFYLLQSWNTCACGLTTNYSEGQNNRGFPGGEGEVMAHELGHGLGRQHTPDLCCDPAYGPWDYSFPNPKGAIARQFGIKLYDGLEVIPPTHWRGRDSTYDIMSYNSPIWITPYTYCALMSALTGGAITCPAGVERSSLNSDQNFQDFAESENGFRFNPGNTSAGIVTNPKRNEQLNNFIYISGRINSDNTALFYPFENLELRQDISNKSSTGSYKIVFEDKDGNSLYQTSFEPEVQDNRDTKYKIFSLLLPYFDKTQKIKLLHNDIEIALRKRSQNVPVINTEALSNFTELKGKQTFNWTASDADGDKLYYSIDFSTDNGQNWKPLRVLLTESSSEIDADFLPGTEEGLLRITATDGFNTTKIQLPNNIRITRKSPEITMLSVISNEKDLTPLYAEANALDPEDGAVSDELSYLWTSSKDGDIGRGHWLVLINLTPGNHVLTMTVTDSEGNKSSSSTEVTIPDKK